MRKSVTEGTVYGDLDVWAKGQGTRCAPNSSSPAVIENKNLI